MVLILLIGYLKETSDIFISALPLDLMPSIGPGLGKLNLSLVALNSKYDLAEGRILTNSSRLPL